jgi:hypothetical protein
MSYPLCEQNTICPHYDVIVVGAGIAGLFTARELLKKYPGFSVAIAEKYKGFGGRTYSYSPPGFPGIQWEMGAGRIHKDHKLLMNLLKEYNLQFVPLNSSITYLDKPGDFPVPNPFESVIIPVYFQPLLQLSKETLANHTIQQIMNTLYGKSKTKKILSYFPYRAEVNTLRADLALKTFFGKGEMGSYDNYGVIAEGFGELVARLKNDLQQRGCIFLQRHKLLNLKKGPGNSTDLDFQFGYSDPKSSGKITLRAEKAVILALHRDALAEIPAFNGWKTLQHLKTKPLLRTYAIFPVQKGQSWFSGMSKIVTPERPRFILPINPAQGTIMISYTDSEDTAEYMKIQQKDGDKALEAVIMEDIRKLFPYLEIPNPLFFKSHPWDIGATYWKPGNYSAEFESLKSYKPLPNTLPHVYLCGESWSMRQAWVEGALESASHCLTKIKL